MRLSILRNGHNLIQKPALGIIKMSMGGQVPGPILVFSYRRKFFGKHMAPWFQTNMRKLTHWSKVETELIASYVSYCNQCNYCASNHGEVVSQASKQKQLFESLNKDPENAAVSDNLKFILPLIKKVTLSPNSLTAEDFEKVIVKGVSKEAIEQALNICASLNIINRLADSFDFEMSKREDRVAGFLNNFGYGMASIPG